MQAASGESAWMGVDLQRTEGLKSMLQSLWLKQFGSPKAKLGNEKPQGETLDDDKLVQAWRKGRVR
jgi:hypothetical protein